VQKPLPVFRAGHGDEVFKWIAKHGQGWINSQLTPDEIWGYVQRLQALTHAEGRSIEELSDRPAMVREHCRD